MEFVVAALALLHEGLGVLGAPSKGGKEGGKEGGRGQKKGWVNQACRK